MPRRLRRVLRDVIGLEVRRARPRRSPSLPPAPAAVARANQLPKSAVLAETDEFFLAVFADAARRSGSDSHAPPPFRVRDRMYNLAELVRATSAVPGLVAECGCWRGLSTAIIAAHLELESEHFDGRGFHVFDSFAGISELTEADRPNALDIPVGGVAREKGLFAATMEEVRAALSGWPAIELHRGWIPAVFDTAPAGQYRLVHIDVDLFEPTQDSLEFFHPRMSPGGVIVCDDYGSIRWPGARAAVDGYCAATGARLLRLASGQAVILAPDVV